MSSHLTPHDSTSSVNEGLHDLAMDEDAIPGLLGSAALALHRQQHQEEDTSMELLLAPAPITVAEEEGHSSSDDESDDDEQWATQFLQKQHQSQVEAAASSGPAPVTRTATSPVLYPATSATGSSDSEEAEDGEEPEQPAAAGHRLFLEDYARALQPDEGDSSEEEGEVKEDGEISDTPPRGGLGDFGPVYRFLSNNPTPGSGGQSPIPGFQYTNPGPPPPPPQYAAPPQHLHPAAYGPPPVIHHQQQRNVFGYPMPMQQVSRPTPPPPMLGRAPMPHYALPPQRPTPPPPHPPVIPPHAPLQHIKAPHTNRSPITPTNPLFSNPTPVPMPSYTRSDIDPAAAPRSATSTPTTRPPPPPKPAVVEQAQPAAAPTAGGRKKRVFVPGPHFKGDDEPVAATPPPPPVAQTPTPAPLAHPPPPAPQPVATVPAPTPAIVQPAPVAPPQPVQAAAAEEKGVYVRRARKAGGSGAGTATPAGSAPGTPVAEKGKLLPSPVAVSMPEVVVAVPVAAAVAAAVALEQPGGPGTSPKAVYERRADFASRPPPAPSGSTGPVTQDEDGLPLTSLEKARSLPVKLKSAFPEDAAEIDLSASSSKLYGPATAHAKGASDKVTEWPNEASLHGFWASWMDPPVKVGVGKAVYEGRAAAAARLAEEAAAAEAAAAAAAKDVKMDEQEEEDTRRRVEIFIDNSNIMYSFLAWVRARAAAKPNAAAAAVAASDVGPDGKKRKKADGVMIAGKRVRLDYTTLFAVLERGRNVKRRVMAGSSPLWQEMRTAVEWGYEVSLLQRVPRVTLVNAVTGGKVVQPLGGGGAGQSQSQSTLGPRPAVLDSVITAPDGQILGKRPSIVVDKKEKAKAAKTANGTAAGSTVRAAGERRVVVTEKHHYKEQAVDELLHMKILESLLDHTPSPNDPRPLIVLATGDAGKGEYNPGGFMSVIRRALERGWDVEIIAFKRHGMATTWFGEEAMGAMAGEEDQVEEGHSAGTEQAKTVLVGKGRLKIVDLELFSEELVAV